jgi:NO-binding membrane sensor protein with MHYT domain
VGSSITMGGIGIWCMHYIANRAIILLDANDASSQISYNAGYTTLSFFVPILVLLAAFSMLGTNETTSKTRILIGGTLAGLAICGMHYLGQAGISNYSCSYRIANVVGAAVIAVFASVTALAVFFVLRAAWTNSWWKRATCAMVLAGAVSGMHWTAASGTQYRFRARVIGSQQNLTGKQAVTMVIIFVRRHLPCRNDLFDFPRR